MPLNPSDDAVKLLPYGSTPLEKDVASVFPFNRELWPIFSLIARAKGGLLYPGALVDDSGDYITDDDHEPLSTTLDVSYQLTHESYAAWLAIEFNVNRFSEFISDPLRLLGEGIYLNRYMGTAYGVEYAMRLLGFPEAFTWEHPKPCVHFPEYHVDLKKVPANAWDCCRIARFAKTVQPIRCRLRRLYAGFDQRPMVLSERSRLSGGDTLLSDDSGIRLSPIQSCTGTDNNMIVSFRRTYMDDVTVAVDVDAYHRTDRFYLSTVTTRRWPTLDEDFESGFYDGLAFGVIDLPDYLMDEDADPLCHEDGSVIVT